MQNKISFSWENYKKVPVIGIVRGLNITIVKQIAEAYLSAGFHTLEVTMNTKNAVGIISKLRTDFPKLNIGAGTVCNLEDLHTAISAGAQFIVTPILDEEVVRASFRENIPIFPGAYTPTEIYRAWSLGASAVKVFPATQLGPQFIKDVLAPLNDIKLLPTGGVSQENIRSFFEAGVSGVGMGNALFDKELIKKSDFEGLENHFLHIKQEIVEFLKQN